MKGLFDGQEKTCPMCRNTFIVYGEQWGYKMHGIYFCSWHCLRDYENGGDGWWKKEKNKSENG